MTTTIRKEQGGVAKGGNAGDVYTKNSGADYDADFLPPAGGIGLFNVNADETISTWFTTYVTKVWTSPNFALITTNADYSVFSDVNHAGQNTFDVLNSPLPSLGGAKGFRLKWYGGFGNIVAGDSFYTMRFNGAGTLIIDYNTITANTWIFKAGTNVNISAFIAANTNYLWEIVGDAVSTKLYQDGILIASTVTGGIVLDQLRFFGSRTATPISLTIAGTTISREL